MSKRMNLEWMKRKAKSLQDRMAADREAYQRLRSLITQEEQRVRLLAAIGVEGGVTVSHGVSTPRLRGREATVIKVNRSKAVVTVNRETWVIPFEQLHVDAFTAELEQRLNQAGGQ